MQRFCYMLFALNILKNDVILAFILKSSHTSNLTSLILNWTEGQKREVKFFSVTDPGYSFKICIKTY